MMHVCIYECGGLHVCLLSNTFVNIYEVRHMDRYYIMWNKVKPVYGMVYMWCVYLLAHSFIHSLSPSLCVCVHNVV